MTDKCQCCGEEGTDRRTLWMACLYEMSELNVPFKSITIDTLETSDVVETKAPDSCEVRTCCDGVFTTQTHNFMRTDRNTKQGAEVHQRQFYTLRVCKDCRANWMQAIQGWFDKGREQRESTGTGVYLRKNGATYEASQDEVNELVRNRK
jgi:hypothetical protein